MDRPAAFVLNLDADLELASRDYRPTRAIERAVAVHAAALARSLLRPGDVVVDATSEAGSCQGFVGRAFSPTPRALAILRRVGAELPEAPTPDVLARVCRRDFAYRCELHDSRVSDDPDEVLDHVRGMLARGNPVRLKRVYGMAGRGHRSIRTAITDSDAAFVRASRGLVVEPEVAIVREFALHGFLSSRGALVCGRIVGSVVDDRGVWRDSLALENLPEKSPVEALDASLVDAAGALRSAGYHGPFGIDAFEYRDGDRLSLRSRSEINARYSMGWALGMRTNGTRPDLTE